ncbi:MAG: YdcF family protein [Clostridia bacterium]|nr:YdcF family protein [Clostridia bacterium]
MTILSIALAITGIIILVIFSLPIFILGVLNTGNYIGLLLGSLLISYGIFFKSINRFTVKLWKHKPGMIGLLALALIVAFMLCFTIVVTVKIVNRANVPYEGETTVVVLGCRVREDGASKMLKTRLDAAYTFLSEHPEANCVLSGGKGNDEPISEAQYMYDWLTEKGIDKERLYIEDRSTSTEENLKFTRELIQKNNLCEKITLITNEFHQYRAYRFAVESGFSDIYSYSAKTPLTLLPTYYVREVCGVAHMIFIG